MKKQLKQNKNQDVLKSSRFCLKKMKLSYVNNNYLAWFDDYEVKKFLEYSPNKNLRNLRMNVETTLKEKNVLFYAIFNKNKHIGNVKIEKIDLKKSSAYLGILIGDKRWRHKGAGSEIIEKICDYLFTKYNISKIFLGLQRKNIKALNLYKKSGFVIVKKINPRGYLGYLMYRNYFINKLILGTAQLSSNYGIANKTGKMRHGDLRKIKNLAIQKGMVTVETAQAYGHSEKILGKTNFSKFNLISKIPKINNNSNLNNLMSKLVNESLKKLRIKKIYALLLHNPSDLLSKDGQKIFRILNRFKKKGIIKNIGIAVYDVTELEAISKNLNLTLFQFHLIY